jgi:hypothetical protein
MGGGVAEYDMYGDWYDEQWFFLMKVFTDSENFSLVYFIHNENFWFFWGAVNQKMNIAGFVGLQTDK